MSPAAAAALNNGKIWSEMDFADLRASIEAGHTIVETAILLGRTTNVPEEAKARELDLEVRHE
jgi:hypothetical protein